MYHDVSLRPAQSYETAVVEGAVRAALCDLGGLQNIIKPGSRVLVKANLLMRRAPERATTTHPQVVRALCLMLRELGCEVTIGDSPGGPLSAPLLSRVYEGTGMAEAARQTGAILSLDTGFSVVPHRQGRVCKSFEVCNMVLQADAVISVGKLKTHGLTGMTGGVKNLFGAVPGTYKPPYHSRFPDPMEFAGMLVDLCQLISPALTVVDAVEGMEGKGPSGGRPRKIGAIVASQNPFAADVVGAHLMGFDPMEVPMLAQAAQRGLLSEEMRVVGGAIEDLAVPDFDRPRPHATTHLAANMPILSGAFTRLMLPRPVFRHEKCNGCGICARDCPEKVIAMKENRPHVNLKGCIRCFCCQELCPRTAVDIQSPLISRIFK